MELGWKIFTALPRLLFLLIMKQGAKKESSLRCNVLIFCVILFNFINKANVSSSLDLYEFVIPEDLPIGNMGGKVKANDRDIGENSKSTYGIVEGDDQGVFEIITDTQTQEGILRLKKVS